MPDRTVAPNQFTGRLREKLARAEAWKTNPFLDWKFPWRPCTVRILMVCDGFLYFSDEDFGLSDVLAALKAEDFPYVRFEITTAHRDSVSDARLGIGNPHVSKTIKQINFADAAKFNPADYDEVWLFGSQRSAKLGNGTWTNRLTDQELRVLCQFMDGGGGIFATGDHEDLGCAMGGFLPRVRSMRRWFFPVVGPNGEGLAPPFEGADRFDTNQEGHDGGYQFEDQSDDIPQPIEPKFYSAKIGPFREATWPHPLLCGPNGVIRVLPDHAHESQCTAAATLTWTTTLDGYNVTEFPAATDGGLKPRPEVVAWGRVIGGHLTSGKDGVTNARRFGVIGAYDGHRASVGRVAVDSTWHHFININLTGDSTMPFPKSVGFLATPAGEAHYAEIIAYFRNIALWLARPAKIQCMRNWSALVFIDSVRFAEIYNPQITLETAKLYDYLIVGRHAKDAIGKFASRCQSTRWVFDFIRDLVLEPIWVNPLDPWAIRVEEGEAGDRKDKIEPPRPNAVDLSWIADAAFGGAILAIRQEFFPLDERRFAKITDDVLAKVIATGGQRALDAAAGTLKEERAALDAAARSLTARR